MDTHRFDSPDDVGHAESISIVWGAKAKPPVFGHGFGFAVRVRPTQWPERDIRRYGTSQRHFLAARRYPD
jgi:hypothetical protein